MTTVIITSVKLQKVKAIVDISVLAHLAVFNLETMVERDSLLRKYVLALLFIPATKENISLTQELATHMNMKNTIPGMQVLSLVMSTSSMRRLGYSIT